MARDPIRPVPRPSPAPGPFRPVPPPPRPPAVSLLPPSMVAERNAELARKGRETPERFERITPFIVVKLFDTDKGERWAQGSAEGTITVSQANDPAKKPLRLIPGHQYAVSVIVWNIGAAPVLMGFAEYYALTTEQLEGFGWKGTPRIAGFTDFRLEPMQSTTIRFPQLFTMPADPKYGRVTFLVQCYDLAQDPVRKPGQYFMDRHVARIVRGMG